MQNKGFFNLTVVNVLCTDEIPGRNPACVSLQKKKECDIPLVICTSLNRKDI